MKPKTLLLIGGAGIGAVVIAKLAFGKKAQAAPRVLPPLSTTEPSPSPSPAPPATQQAPSYVTLLDVEPSHFYTSDNNAELFVEAEAGAVIRSAAHGYVTFAGWHSNDAGHVVMIQISEEIRLVYAMMGLAATDVGNEINAGDPVGYVSGDHSFAFMVQRTDPDDVTIIRANINVVNWLENEGVEVY